MTENLSDVPWSDLAPSALRLPVLAYRHRVWLSRLLVQLQAKLNVGDTRVVVLGRPGVGKSLLLSRLTHADKSFSWRPPEPSTDAEAHALPSGREARLCRVVPGETSLERDRWVHEAFSKHSSLRGVIYVADWGFTAERSEAVRRTFVGKRGVTTVQEWRDLNLEQELKDFRATCARIRETANLSDTGLNWLLILVNKADLFFNNLDDAQDYYHPRAGGLFADVVADLHRVVGENTVRVNAAPVIAWPEDFEWNGEVVESRTGGEANARGLLASALHFITRLDR